MFQTLRQAPFLRLVLFFTAGIITQYYHDVASFSIIGIGISFIFLVVSQIPWFNRQYSLRWFFGFGILVLSFFSASFLTRNALQYSDWDLLPEVHEYQVRILEEPSQKPKSRMCKAQILSVDSEASLNAIGKKAILYLALDSAVNQIVAGDCLRVRARLDKPGQLPGSDSFDYPAYLRKQGYAATGFVPKGFWQREDVQVSGWDVVRFQASACRRNLLKYLHQMIPDEKSCSVASAMVFGYRNDMDKGLLLSFSATGASHVLSVSGMHTAILYGAIYFMLSSLGMSARMRILRQLIIIPLMWWFAFLTGLSPSVVRATLMISFAGVGDALSQRSLTFNTVGASAFLMLLVNPLSLFDVGFQLSFMAVMGIVVVNPLLVKFYEVRRPVAKYVWDLCCVSTSAQLGTLPMSIYYFHQFPLAFLITNLFVIPLVGILMILVPISLLLFQFFHVYSWIFYPANWLMHFFISGVEWLEKIPYGTLYGLQLDGMETCLMYLFLIFATYLLVKKRIVYLYLLALLVVFHVIYYLCNP